MYKILPASPKEYMSLIPYAIESGKADFSALSLCDIDKLVWYRDDGTNMTLALIGHREIMFDEYPGKKFVLVCGIFTRDVKYHKRALIQMGDKYLDSLQTKYPLIALADAENPVYNKFLKDFGFEFTNSIEKNPVDDKVYNVYVRY